MPRDTKYGLVLMERGKHIPDDEPVMVFRFRDKAFEGALAAYVEECKRLGAPERHVELASGQLEALRGWQTLNPDRVVVPSSSNVSDEEMAR